ncbi:MAG: thiol-activated cytolysin family protein [Bacteroidales bacterium]|nr:thiol-activated cytolysin family protein [Bacteroidales bacterium]
MKAQLKKLIFLFISIGIIISCSKKEEETPITFDSVIKSGGSFTPAEKSEEVVDETNSTETIDGEEWNCTTTTYNALEPGGGNKGFPLFNPNASVIYPGSLLQGNSLKQSTPNVIAVDRAGGTISYDLVNGNLASSFPVDEVSKSSISVAMNNIIANSPPDLPSNFVFNYSQVQSEQAMALQLGVDFESAFADISADFGFSQNSSYNRILVELNQSFYTMSFDIPTSNADLFAPSVTPDDLAKYVQEGNPATYISDVTYGRIYYMLIESSSTYTEMEASVQASLNGVVNSANIDISGNTFSSLENLKIKVMAFGGEATTSLLTVGVSDLNDLVGLLAQSTTISTGVPISYVVRSVYDNQIVSVQLATEYDVTNCEPAPVGGAPAYTAHWEGNVISKIGGVGAAFSRYGTEFVLISLDGTQYLVSKVGELDGPYPIETLGGGPLPWSGGIGAACRIDGNNEMDSWTMIMDMTGTQYTYLRSDSTWSTQVQPISNLATGNVPFALNGIGALIFNYHESSGPSRRYMVNKDGTLFSLYYNNPNSFDPVYDITDWAGGGLPFAVKKVGAGIGFYIGNKKYYLLFNLSGDKYCISGDVFGTGTNEFIGPFDL